MNRIRLLPEQVANQIAAGEVIERPASVVKELVENALDAGARRITVEIQAGGRSLIRVTDDGIGMSRDDALLSLERHATSKIQRAEDLAAIATLGFRGEALPSIASVSRFTLTTREREGGAVEGTQLCVAGGKLLEVRSAGSAPGTSVEVRQLFFNLPARRKFMRSEETEAAHIQHYLVLAALAFPEVAFVFHKDGRLVWQLPALKTGPDVPARLAALRERLRALYGDESRFLAVDFTARIEAGTEPSEPSDASASLLRLWGFMGAPGVSRATREDQHLFVNRRPVENRGLNFALLEGYHTALMKGRYPVCCLFLELAPAVVDVNIHPAKREVKFHREFEVRRLVTQAVRQALLTFHAGGQAQAGEGRGVDSERPPAAAKADEQRALPNFPAGLPPAGMVGSSPRPAQPPLRMGFAPAGGAAPPAPAPSGQRPSAPARPAVMGGGPPAVQPSGAMLPEAASQDATAATVSTVRPAVSSAPTPLLDVPLRLIGVVGRLYVLLESDRGLVLMDQHAAHERVLFEQVLERLERGDRSPSQKLLLPATVELAPRDAAFLREQLPVLTRLGVGLSEFGERTFLLDALPPFVRVGDARRFVLDLLDELKAAGREVNSLRLGEQTVAKTVCRHAVKAHDPLSGPELVKLLEALRRCAMPYTCPHGRPTLVEINYRELEKKFGRLP